MMINLQNMGYGELVENTHGSKWENILQLRAFVNLL